MVNNKTIFQGFSEQDQLNRIFKIRGTPNEVDFPGLEELQDWNV